MKMKKTILIKILIINIFLIGQAFAQQNIELKNTKLDNKTINKTPVIIMFKNGNNNGDTQSQSNYPEIIHNKGGKIKLNFHYLNGVAAELLENAIKELSKNKDILYIEQDTMVYAHQQ